MRTLQDYISIYREVAQNLGIGGDSVEVLVQLLANASYINEVENISYVQEASLERATLENSKIQHCMNNMYSVFRGNCPRVILKFKTGKYLSFQPYDKVVSSNNFNLYYLGYLDENRYVEKDDEKRVPVEQGFIYSTARIKPDDEATIICLLTNEVVTDTWTVDSENMYYVESSGTNLSNDMTLRIGNIDKTENITRTFSDHILRNLVFDLTVTDYGSRLYFATLKKDEENTITLGTTIEASYFKYTGLAQYNESELKKINIKGTELQGFDSEYLEARGYTELIPGIILVPEIGRDNIDTIHYKANRDRYVNSIIRSNSDLGTMLEEMFPNKICPSGTNCVFSNSGLQEYINLYYVPKDENNLLTRGEASDFLELRLPYFLIGNKNNVVIKKGRKFMAKFRLGVVVSSFDTSGIDKEVEKILIDYTKKFGINFSLLKGEIYTKISKIAKILDLSTFEIEYIDDNNSSLGTETLVQDLDLNLNLDTICFATDYNIYTTMKS